ncbi:hypothetical protein DFH06DRAFT_1130739 [Mycena polygramma]|nr:hypothetical protein DFH06DRAFT_1130739 [Mycena polygramma]
MTCKCLQWGTFYAVRARHLRGMRAHKSIVNTITMAEEGHMLSGYLSGLRKPERRREVNIRGYTEKRKTCGLRQFTGQEKEHAIVSPHIQISEVKPTGWCASQACWNGWKSTEETWGVFEPYSGIGERKRRHHVFNTATDVRDGDRTEKKWPRRELNPQSPADSNSENADIVPLDYAASASAPCSIGKKRTESHIWYLGERVMEGKVKEFLENEILRDDVRANSVLSHVDCSGWCWRTSQCGAARERRLHDSGRSKSAGRGCAWSTLTWPGSRDPDLG